MSAHLVDATVVWLRSQFTRTEVRDVLPYGGEFSAAEVEQLSFSCPALLVACLGWKPATQSRRLSGRFARQASMAAFVVTKDARRPERMRLAALLAERTCQALQLWTPEGGAMAPLEIAGLETAPTTENLYSRGVDRLGLALWIVRWQQCVHPLVSEPQIYDLLRIEIEDHVRQGTTPPESGPSGTVPVVTEDVTFNPLN